jgi:hypothetical protein
MFKSFTRLIASIINHDIIFHVNRPQKFHSRKNEEKNRLILQSPRKFFKMKFFFSLPGEVFLVKKKKKVFMKNLPGASNTFSKLNNQAKSIKIIPRNNKTLIYLIFRPE